MKTIEMYHLLKKVKKDNQKLKKLSLRLQKILNERSS